MWLYVYLCPYIFKGYWLLFVRVRTLMRHFYERRLRVCNFLFQWYMMTKMIFNLYEVDQKIYSRTIFIYICCGFGFLSFFFYLRFHILKHFHCCGLFLCSTCFYLWFISIQGVQELLQCFGNIYLTTLDER